MGNFLDSHFSDFWFPVFLKRMGKMEKVLEQVKQLRKKTYDYDEEVAESIRVQSNEICRNTKDLMWRTEHMITEDTYKIITKLRAYLAQIPSDKKGDIKKEFKSVQ